MNTNKKALLGLLALGFLLSCARAPQQVITEELIRPTASVISKKIKPSIVLVKGDFGSASGFFVAHDKIATNLHIAVFPGAILAKSSDNLTEWTVEGVAAYDLINDLVILKISGEGTPLSLTDSNDVRIGEPIFAVGYSGGNYKVTEGTIHSIRNRDKWLVMQINTFGGSSGSPVLNRNGQVVGVDDAGLPPSYSYAIPSNVLRALLTRSKLTEPLAQWQKKKQIIAFRYYTQANVKFQNEHYEDAVVDLNKSLQLNPAFGYAYFGRANSKVRLAESEVELRNMAKARVLYQEIVEDLNETIGLHPDYGDAYSLRGAAKFEISKFESNKGNAEEALRMYAAAIEDYAEAIQLEPNNFRIYYSRGQMKSDQGTSKVKQGDVADARRLYQEAIADFTKVIRLEPEFAKAFHQRAWLKSEMGKFEVKEGHKVNVLKLYQEAIEDLTKVIQLEPASANAYNDRAWVKNKVAQIHVEKSRKGQARQMFIGAIEDCTQAIQLDSEFAYAYNNRGWAQYLLGKAEVVFGDLNVSQELYEAALIDIEKSIQLDSDNAYAYRYRGQTKEALGQKEAAKADFDKAKKLDPDVGK